MQTYYGWGQVPWYLTTATQLGGAAGVPAAPRKCRWPGDLPPWRGSRTELDLYDVRTAEPTGASAGQLVPAEAAGSVHSVPPLLPLRGTRPTALWSISTPVSGLPAA